MIDKITGIIEEISDDSIKILCADITYHILISCGFTPYLQKHNKKGDKISVFTIYYIENGIGGSSLHPKLIGFRKNIEREFFEKYITVKGLGIKTGLKSFALSVRHIAQAIENSELKIICRLPGIGKRTAEKIIAELRGRVTKYALIKEDDETVLLPEPIEEEDKNKKEKKNLKTLSKEVDELEHSMKKKFEVEIQAEQVLAELGYSKNEADDLIRNIYTKNPEIENTEQLIKEIFKQQRKI